MMKYLHKFVTNIPDNLEDGIIYISMEFATAIHKCPSGCGKEVVTPFSPTDWELTFNGNSISLSPSIGNWSYECQSHYWIIDSEVKWAPKWNKQQIQYGRDMNIQNKNDYFSIKPKSKRNPLWNFFFKNKK